MPTKRQKAERDVGAEFRACAPAQQQAIQAHMDRHFDPNREVDEAYAEELLKAALDAEVPFFARRARGK